MFLNSYECFHMRETKNDFFFVFLKLMKGRHGSGRGEDYINLYDKHWVGRNVLNLCPSSG